jgi:hypothetical protein
VIQKPEFPSNLRQTESIKVTSETPRWPPLDENAQVVWPEDQEEQVQLARRLFGKALVETMDCYINLVTDYATNPLPDKPYEIDNYYSEKDRTYRRCFASMTSKQREIILHMIRGVIDGVLISSLTRLDQFWMAEVKISLVGRDTSRQPIEIPITSVEAELARQFVECTDLFSEHAARLADDLKLPPTL